MCETQTLSIYTLSLIIAVIGTRQLAAVVSRVALMAHALPVHTSSIVVALIRAGGHRAIRALPAWVADTAADVLLVESMPTTACVHSWGKKV